jgi:hypothetical protein
LGGPLIFLAGPIQGAPNWHGEAIAFLEGVSGLQIASPRRLETGGKDFSEEVYREQIAWEHFHLKRAGENGVTLFWLARETAHQCDRAYAQTTRFELGEAVTLHRWKGIKVVVGIEIGFSNARYLKTTIASKAPDIPLCSTLQQTCEIAIRLAFSTFVPDSL